MQILQKLNLMKSLDILFMKNYVALYLVEDEEDKKVVTIMHVFYAKRDYEKLV